MVKGMTSSESEISNEKSNESENSLKTRLKLATNLQPTCNLATDCISRQAAIDALGGNEPVGDPSKMDDDDVVKMWERIRIINIINKLPPAQPETHEERTETHACDLISRQAAIDALDCINGVEEVLRSLPAAQPDLSGYSDRLWKAAYERGKAEAQPDIIHCGECKHRDPEDHKCDCGHDILWQLPRDDEWYCADAERKEGETDEAN